MITFWKSFAYNPFRDYDFEKAEEIYQTKEEILLDKTKESADTIEDLKTKISVKILSLLYNLNYK